MSETETKIEIEDVLASIRRLVSRDAGAVQTRGIPHRSAAPQPAPEQDVECLVLTPAHRVAETEAAPAPDEDFVEMSGTSSMAAAPEDTLPDTDVANAGWAEAATEPNDAVALAVIEAAETGAATWSPEMERDLADAALADDAAPEPEAVADTWPEATVQDHMPVTEPAMPRLPTEAEALLAEAEAALAETGAVLEDATTALGTADAADPAPETLAETGLRPVDIVDELARLESTIAELEAAVAESGADCAPEQDDPVTADMDGPDEWPEDFAAPEPAPAPETTEAEATCAPPQASADLPDPDLVEAAWTEPAPMGMDWAEATLRLAERGPRRFTREEAELAMPQPDPVQSSYASLREELAQEDMLEGAAQPNIPETLLDDAMIDEATLREIVGQMVRAELRGALGERITQNVRKLVRREIQRALMGQDFD